jgi:DNA-binding MarR family transcriptional regulator
MNYIEQINYFWTLREEEGFTSTEADLYFYLLNKSNRLGWKNPFKQTNERIMIELGVTKPSLIRAKNKLQQSGLIRFEPGKKRNPTSYELIGSQIQSNIIPESVTVSVTECDTENVTVCDQKPVHINKHKLNKTKRNNNICPYQDIVEMYHHHCPSLPKVQSLGDTRKKHIKARWKEHGQNFNKFIRVFKSAESSDHHSGRSGKWDGCNLDWLMKPTNFTKMLERKKTNGNGPTTDEQHELGF